MKKLPSKFSINVFGAKVPVSTADSLILKRGIVAEYDPQKTSVVIDSSLSEDEKIKALVHEICHAMLHRTGVTQTMSREMEEVVCNGVENLIFENFRLSLK